MIRITRLLLPAAAMAVAMASCVSTPTSFTRGVTEWSVIELHGDIDYDQAWEEVADALARRFDLEMVEKDTGYIRTSWIYTWWKDGKHTENYRVRAMVKFTPGKESVALKTDAQYLEQDGWTTGADTLLLDTLKTDIMGTVGRTTR